MSEFTTTENMSETDYGSHEDEIAIIEKNTDKENLKFDIPVKEDFERDPAKQFESEHLRVKRNLTKTFQEISKYAGVGFEPLVFVPV